MQVSGDMLISQLIRVGESVPPIPMRAGMHCLGCPASQDKSLEGACIIHGVDCDTLVFQVNETLATKAR